MGVRKSTRKVRSTLLMNVAVLSFGRNPGTGRNPASRCSIASFVSILSVAGSARAIPLPACAKSMSCVRARLPRDAQRISIRQERMGADQHSARVEETDLIEAPNDPEMRRRRGAAKRQSALRQPFDLGRVLRLRARHELAQLFAVAADEELPRIAAGGVGELVVPIDGALHRLLVEGAAQALHAPRQFPVRATRESRA